MMMFFKEALLKLIDIFLKPNPKKLAEAREFLARQVLELRDDGEHLVVDQAVCAYAMAAIICITKRPSDLDVVREILREVYPEQECRYQVEQVIMLTEISDVFWNYVDQLMPVVNAELESGTASYLIKYTRKARKEIEKLFKPMENSDLSKMKDLDILDV